MKVLAPDTASRPVPTADPGAKRVTWPAFEEPSAADLDQLARLRNLGADGLLLASKRGILRTGCHRGHRCWIVTDPSRLAAQARRLDGQPWPSGNGPLKALSLPGSVGSHPVGIAALKPQHRSVLFCEGAPDLLAAHHFIACEGREDDACAVGMMGAELNPLTSHLAALEGRHVRIVEHNDEPGRRAAEHWARLIHGHAESVSILSLAGLRQRDGSPVGDMNELCNVHPDDFEADRAVWSVVP